MRHLGIVLGVLAVAALATSAYGFKITNVTNDEVVFKCGYETATVGENVQTDTPEIGTYNFMGWYGPSPGTLGDSQEHHWVEDEASTGVAAKYGQQYHRVEPGVPRPYAAAFFDGTPGVDGDQMKVEFAIMSISEWPGIALKEQHATDMTSAPPYPKSIGSLWFTGPGPYSWPDPGWTDEGGIVCQANGYNFIPPGAHTPGEWNEVVVEYTNGSTDMDITVNGNLFTVTNMNPGILNYVSFASPSNYAHAYLDAVGGAASFLADFNNDGVIDDLDLTILATNWDQTGKTHEEGDANGDGNVDDLDLTALATEWPSGDLEASVVPEPAMLSLLALGGLAALRRRRH